MVGFQENYRERKPRKSEVPRYRPSEELVTRDRTLKVALRPMENFYDGAGSDHQIVVSVGRSVVGWVNTKVFDDKFREGARYLIAHDAFVKERYRGKRYMRDAYALLARAGYSVMSGPGHSIGSRKTYAELARGVAGGVRVLIVTSPEAGHVSVDGPYDGSDTMQNHVYQNQYTDNRYSKAPRLLITATDGPYEVNDEATNRIRAIRDKEVSRAARKRADARRTRRFYRSRSWMARRPTASMMAFFGRPYDYDHQEPFIDLLEEISDGCRCGDIDVYDLEDMGYVLTREDTRVSLPDGVEHRVEFYGGFALIEDHLTSRFVLVRTIEELQDVVGVAFEEKSNEKLSAAC